MQLLVASPRIGWEEKQLLRAAEQRGVTVGHLDPGRFRSFLLPGGARAEPPELAARPVVLMRCPGYFQSIELAAALERHGIVTYNDAAHLTLFGRKTLTDAWMAGRGLPVVPSCVAFSAEGLEAVVEALGLPLVMKPSIGGFGRRVHAIESLRELRQAWEYLEDFAPAHHELLYVQRRVEVAHDVRVCLLDGEVLASMEREGEGLAKNVARGGAGRPFSLGGEAKEVVLRLGRSLPRGFFGVDLLLDRQGGVWVSEINATCGFREAQAVTEGDLAGEIVGAAVRLRS